MYVHVHPICICILHRQMQLCALSLLGLYHPRLVVCQAMDYVGSLRSLGQWLTDAAIGRQTGPPPYPHIHPVNRCKFQTRCATLTPSPFLLSNCVLCLPSTCITLLNIVFSPATNKMDSFLPSTNISFLGFWQFAFLLLYLKSSHLPGLPALFLLASTWRI